MKVRGILHAKGASVVTIDPDATVEMAIHKLRLEGVGAVVVSRDGEHTDGIVSERDVVRALCEERGDLLGQRVSTIMSRNVETCSPDDSVKQLMTTMTNLRVRHVPVVQDGRLCGIVSVGDIVKSRLAELELEANVMREAYITTH